MPLSVTLGRLRAYDRTMIVTLVAAALAVAQPAPAQTGPVEVPFQVGDDAIIVDAFVNNKKVALMFDTGFSGAVVLNNAINVGPVTGSQGLQDFVGTMTAQTADLRSLRLGNVALNPGDKDVVLLPMADMSLGYGIHTDGILGVGAMKDRTFEINFERKRLIFHPKSTDISQRKPDGKRTFLSRILPIGSMEMEVTTRGGKRMVLALDTGNAFYATTHKDVLQRVGLWEPNREPKFIRLAGVASGPVESWYKRMNDLSIFGVPVKTSVWSIIDLPSSSAEGDGTIGFGFLRNFNIIVDYERRRVWLENFTGKVDDPGYGDVGISAAYEPQRKRVRIFRVSPGSPAERAGLKRGDDLLSVNGVDLRDQGFRAMQRLLEGEPGSTVRVAASRDGNLLRHELKREFLVNEPSSGG